MSSLLPLHIRQLPPEKLAELRDHFRNSPKASRLIEFIVSLKEEKLSTREAVKQVYGVKHDIDDYAVYENRYYKLRKKIEDHLNVNAAPSNAILTDEEKMLHEAKMLLAGGRFAEAEKILMTTEKNCLSKNIFEILPEALDALIQARQSLNKIEENIPLHRSFRESLTLYADLMEAKNLARQVFEVNFKLGIKAAEPLFKRLAKLDRKHKQYPRFKLIYNFVAGYYKVGAGGKEYLDKTNVTNRHIGVARKLMRQFPDMPAVHYSATGQAAQHYRLMELQAMCYYNALRFDEAAEEMLRLYASVMQPQSSMNRMKNEILFTNAIHMLVAANRFAQALQTARDYLKFLLANKRHEQVGNAYAEIANIHISMHPNPSGYDPVMLLKRLNEYLAAKKKEKGDYFDRSLLMMKARLLFTLDQVGEAEKLLNSTVMRQLKDERHLISDMLELASLMKAKDAAFRKQNLQLLKNESRRKKINATSPGEFLFWRWMEKMTER